MKQLQFIMILNADLSSAYIYRISSSSIDEDPLYKQWIQSGSQ